MMVGLKIKRHINKLKRLILKNLEILLKNDMSKTKIKIEKIVKFKKLTE